MSLPILTSNRFSRQTKRKFNPGGGSGFLADWNNRSTAAGVKQAIRFNLSANVTNWRHLDGDEANITRDATAGLIGDGAMLITHPAASGASPGAWRIPFDSSTNGSTPAGTIFVGVSNPVAYYRQYMVKLGTGMLTPSNGGGGFKLSIQGEYRFSAPNNAGSHSNNEIVHNNQSWYGIPFAYRSDHTGGTTQISHTDGNGIHLQSAVDHGSGTLNNRYCLYNSGSASAGCYFWQENVWYCIKDRILINSIGTSSGTGNHYEQWIAAQGDTSWTKLHDVTDSDFTIGSDPLVPNGPNGNWFTTYDTGRVNHTVDKLCWYDQLIISLNDIALPVW